MTPAEFISKWKAAELKERAACQEHFLDLCAVLEQQTPAAADPKGEWYTFEYGLKKNGGGQGYADVWKKGHFGWEYKGKRKDLNAAFNQLAQYREALQNPPLLIVCDLNRFEIHTNFTGTVKEVHSFDLDGLADAKNLDKLRLAFAKPEELKPGRTQRQVTEEVAAKFALIAKGMQKRNIDAHDAGQFLMKLMFCMFAEDMDLLPRDLFLKTVRNTKWDEKKLSRLLKNLFEAMAYEGGLFGADEIAWFNGGLFKNSEVVELTKSEIRLVAEAAEADWSNVEPSIFGTLFERILNPSKRSQLGAHYTSREDIETLVQPVMMVPLRREWAEVKAKAEKLYATAKKAKELKAFENLVFKFLDRLAAVEVLDPACGSGNFLYVALHLLLDLEKEVLTYATSRGLNRAALVRPTQLHGIEINAYAQELAQVVIWIGYLQWMKFNGFPVQSEPILDSMENIECRDAILDLTDPANPKEPDWPAAEFIVGNPPFLGDKKMLRGLGIEYVAKLRSCYRDKVPGGADLVAYWFNKAGNQIALGAAKRAGLIATQSIRVGANRAVLTTILERGAIFFAESDRPWFLDGADVRVSMVGFDAGNEKISVLNGQTVLKINADLTCNSDLTQSQELIANQAIAFIGSQKGGDFDVDQSVGLQLLSASGNPHGMPNSDVVRVSINGIDISRRPRNAFIVDFGTDMDYDSACQYHLPFEYIKQHVAPKKSTVSEGKDKRMWWLHTRSRPAFRKAVASISRFIATPRVTKHRIFVWLDSVAIPDSRLVGIAKSDDCSFGILHSRVHECWSLSTSPRHGVGNDPTYNAESCFLTFPFPEPTPAQHEAIAAAAKELDTLRNNWLNPPEWTKTEVLAFPGSVDGPWKRYVTEPNMMGIGTVKYPRLVPKNFDAARELKKRTLTNLYNERPAWLANVHRKLDEAVFAAYGWQPGISDDDLLAKLLALNLERAAKQSENE